MTRFLLWSGVEWSMTPVPCHPPAQAIVDTVETVVERYLADNPPGLLTKIASALPGGSGGDQAS